MFSMNTESATDVFPARFPAETGEAGRLIAVEGTCNLRDLGGFPGSDGRRVKSHMVYRSDDLSGLTESGEVALAARKIRTVIDFRGGEEITLAPNRIPPTVSQVIQLPIDPGNVLEYERMTPENGPEMMRGLYRVLARQAQAIYREFFRLLTDSGNVPLLFHCSAGKDRTGFAAALFLLGLGVPRPAVLADYLRSGDLVREKYRKVVEANPLCEAMYTVQSSYLEAAFEVIDREYGGPAAFLTDRLGVDLDRLRSLYLD